jgi:CRP-like cAMP-binding protein
VSLADVRGLQDLPEEAQAELVAKARIERLSRSDELTGFGIALVLEGWISIMPAIAEVPCARAAAGDVVCTSGTLDEAIVLSAVAGQEDTAVAVWDKSALEQATQDCPWVADELRLIADRYQTLAGVTMGAMGDRLDESLRAMVTERCEVRALMPYEVLVDKGGPVPGLHIVGAGRIEIVRGEGDAAEVQDELGPGDFLFAAQVLQGGEAPAVARAGKSGALVLFAERKVAHELLVSVPPLLEIFAT